MTPSCSLDRGGCCGRASLLTQFGRVFAAAAVLVFAGAAAAQDEPPALSTNQTYIESVTRQDGVATDNPAAVFAFVFSRLPDRVKVYPTENYYYFRFVSGGIPYNGNIRLDAADRDEGKLHFAYSEDLAEWREETDVIHVALDSTNDVAVQKLDRFRYSVAYRGKTVQFELNDLSEVRPPADALGPDESYVGPVFDESGIRFFLVFNTRLKLFHYLLDETVPVADQLAGQKNGRIVVGKRTGFAFYLDDRRPRKILVGVFLGNSRVNNYLDGPFDQLPDNFIVDDSFRDMLLQVAPELKGKIDRFGAWPGGSQRFMIAPYYYYQNVGELSAFDRCATDHRVKPADYYACFVVDGDNQARFTLVPRAIRELGRRNGRHRGG